MVKMLAIYPRQEESRRFEEAYLREHIPLVQRIPGVKKISVSRVLDLNGEESVYQLVSEVWFESQAALQRGLNSEERELARRQITEILSGKATVLFCEEVTG
jgi:uncharacterized protein (TIGR02118 family)